MADTVGEFLIKLGLDADGLDRQLNSVVGNVKSGLSNLMGGVVGPALAGLATGGFVQSFADEITQVGNLSDALGVNIETLSAWRTAAEMAGVEADEVGEIFADFNDWMVDAKFNEGGAMYTDFIQNGILPAVTDANGEMKKTEDYILEFADALHNMDQAQASGIARQIGVSDLKTATWLQQGGDAIRRQLELAKEIGTFTEEDALAAKEYSMSITVLTHSIKMGLLPIFRAIVPILTNIAKGFRELVRNVEPSISYFGKMLGDVFTQVSVIGGQALEFLSKHIISLTPLLAGLAGIKLAGVFSDMASSIKQVVTISRAFIFSPWGAVLAALIAIGVAIEEFIKWLNGGDSVLSGFFEAIFGDADNAKQMIDNFYNSVVDTVSKIVEVFSPLIPKFQELGNAIVALFTAIISSKGFDLFVSAIVAVIGLVANVITWLITFLLNHVDVIAEIIGGIADAFTTVVEVLTAVVNFMDMLITSIVTIVSALGTSLMQLADMIVTIFSALGSAISPVIDVISGVIDSIIGVISGGIGYIVNAVKEIASGMLSALSSIIDGAGDISTEIINSIASGLSGGIDTIRSIITEILGNISSWFSDIGSTGENIATGIINNIASGFNSDTGILSAINGIVDNIYNAINNAIDTLSGMSFGDILSSLFGGVSLDIDFTSVLDNISNTFNSIYGVISGVVSAIINVFTYWVGAAVNAVGLILSALSPIIDIFQTIYQTEMEVITAIVNLFMYLVDSIFSGTFQITEALNMLLSTVMSIGSSISNMFSSMASAFSSFVSSVVSGASSIVGAISDILGKLAELASNSLLGKVIGSVGGSIYGAISSIGNTDNSSTVNTTNSHNNTTYNYYGGRGDSSFIPPVDGYNAY